MSHSIEKDLVPKVAAKYGWSKEVAEQKIRGVQEILSLKHPVDAIEFLMSAVVEPIICDGCNVPPPREHRCHVSKSVIRGKQTNRQCQCPGCFAQTNLK